MKLMHTNCPKLKFFKKGKVRDVYDFNKNILVASTDRISAFDHVFLSCIPEKGIILNQLSKYWFEQTRHITDNHIISFTDFPEETTEYENQFKYRSAYCRKTKVIPIECVVRGYLDGSAWSEYSKGNKLNSGHVLPAGIKRYEKLPKPIFTPAIKADSGHDVNISIKETDSLIGESLRKDIEEISLKLYDFAYNKLIEKQIVLFDTKFEFGLLEDNSLLLIDEILTPDSSRFVVIDNGVPISYDKQFIRNWVTDIGWDKESEPPFIPQPIVDKTREIYISIYEIITSNCFEEIFYNASV